MKKTGNRKGTGLLRRDPHARREAERYESPIASREHLLELIAAADRPVDREGLGEILGIDTEEGIEALRRRLNAMTRDGQLVRNRRGCYAQAEQFDLVPGRIIAHPDGFGFLVPDDKGEKGEDIYLSARQMRTVFHNDRVMVRITGKDRRGRLEGTIVEVLERNTKHVVGRFYRESGINTVVPDNKRVTHDIAVPDKHTRGAVHGQIVTVEIVEQPGKHAIPVGHVVEVLGEHMAPGMEIDIAIRSHDLPQEWPEAVEIEIREFGE
ncbi:MAG: ribonuclease R, partial [Gammaproteobacteria bacterium]|nr:ribonuclease R [Gammaproteobacteria bacterium]